MIGSNTDISQNYRGLTLAKITSRTKPTSGPFSGYWVYEWTEQTFDPSTGVSQDADYPRKGFYNSTTDYGNPIIEPNNAVIAVDSYVWARMKGAVGGKIVYETVIFSAATPEVTSGCASLIGLIREGVCFNLNVSGGVGSSSCVDDQSTTMLWDADNNVMASVDYVYGCAPGVITTLCPDGAPNKYRVIVAGFTGGSTGFNGTYTLTWTSGETWSGVLAGVTATLTQTASTDWSLILDDGAGNTPEWRVAGITDCCADILLTLFNGDGTTTPPATLTAEPVTACGLGTPYTVWLDTCSTDCDGPQPRMRLIPGAESGSAVITLSRNGCSSGGGQFSTSDPVFCTGDFDSECADNLVTFNVSCGCTVPPIYFDTCPLGSDLTSTPDWCIEMTDMSGNHPELNGIKVPMTYSLGGTWPQSWSSGLNAVTICCQGGEDTEPIFHTFTWVLTCEQHSDGTFTINGYWFNVGSDDCYKPCTQGGRDLSPGTPSTGYYFSQTGFDVFDPTYTAYVTFKDVLCAGTGPAGITPFLVKFVLRLAAVVGDCSYTPSCDLPPDHPSWNCLEDGSCVDPGDGSGTFGTLVACQEASTGTEGDCCDVELASHPDLEATYLGFSATLSWVSGMLWTGDTQLAEHDISVECVDGVWRITWWTMTNQAAATQGCGNMFAVFTSSLPPKSVTVVHP